MEKLFKDGKVAVLVSYGYGAGWSTWMYDYNETCLYDPVIAQMILDGASEEDLMVMAQKRYPDAYVGGVDGLTVEWLEPGTKFRINEYDGSESLEFLADVNWYEA